MEAEVLDQIPFELDRDRLLRKLHVKEGSTYAADLEKLVGEALAVARPKALYRIAYIDSKNDESVVIDGETFSSRVLRVNLEDTQRVFLYLATCGTEIEDWSKAFNDDLLYQFWTDAIKELALRSAQGALNDHIKDRFQLGKTITISPGSLEDWPITEQKPFFKIIGDLSEAIGVQLTESCLMLPIKSISGMRFPTEIRFESCQLCPRDVCQGRRAPYDETLYERRFA
ncbi:MAG: hypothetical protein MUO76_12215 [Anaerolineaceae bacterium]|nr:hypothetical protein [Anaerolineaceae bacterium]